MDLVELVYDETKTWPRDEIFGLTSQVRRAAVSVPSNIAEGEGRGSDQDFIRFLNMAHGSLREVETQLLIAVKITFTVQKQIDPILEKCGEVGRLVNGLIRHLRSATSSPADRRPPTADHG